MTNVAHSTPLRHTTLRLGSVSLASHGATIEIDVRILRGSDGAYRVLLAGVLSEPVPTLEGAFAQAASVVAPNALRWRDEGAPPNADEHACPICGAPAPSSPRYPRSVCPACITEVTDRDGRAIELENAALSGGLVARYTDTGAAYSGSVYFVRGLICTASERKLGGVVVQRAD